MINVAGIEIPSTSPIFIAIIAIHVLLGLACVLTGAAAMLSPKRRGGHPKFGTIYFWCLSSTVALATGLSVVRWRQDYPLFILGVLCFAAGLDRTNCETPTLVRMDSLAHYRNGSLIRVVADGFLRR